MKAEKRDKGKLWAMVFGISIMGVLYGWFVYAGEIETEVSKVAQASAMSMSGSGSIPLPTVMNPEAIQMMTSVRNAVEGQQNSGIISDMYNLNPMSPDDALITRHFTDYCSPGLEFGVCETDPLLVFGDVKVSSILTGSSYSTARIKAAQDYMSNLFGNSSVMNFQGNIPMDVGKILADPTLKKGYVSALRDETLLSIMRQPFAEMIAKRTVPEGEDAISEMQFMEERAIKRVFNKQWADSLDGMQDKELQKEQLKMQAYQVWMDYQRYRQMERVEALLSLSALQNHQGAKNAQAALDKATSQGQ